MAPDGACGVAQSTARSNAEFEAERFRKGFRKGFRGKRESAVESNDACSSPGSDRYSVAEHEKACSSGYFGRQVAPRHARAAISSGQWLQSTAEQGFRAQSTPCAVFSNAAGAVSRPFSS